MKHLSSLLMMTALLVVSCQVKEVIGPADLSREKTEIIITASLNDPPLTKTEHIDYKKVYWLPNDEIVIFSAGEASKFTSLNEEPAKTAKFKGQISVISGLNDDLEDSYIWGLYPYRDDATLSDGLITTVLPTSQIGKADSFGDDLLITMGRSLNFSIPFYHVCSGLRFTLTKTGVKSVTLTANGGEPVAGKFSVGINENGKPVINSVIEPSSSVTVVAPDNGSFEPGVWYYIITLPVTFSEGVTFTMFTDEERGSKTINTSFSLKQGEISRSTEMDKSVPYYGICSTPEIVDLGLSVKWASYNLGASAPEGTGYYFAWGETTPKTEYNWETYKFCNGTMSSINKYNLTDNITELEADDDAATVNLGDMWRMPTSIEIDELLDQQKCEWVWTSLNGVDGYEVRSKINGNSIFLPAAGQDCDATVDRNLGTYMTSSLRTTGADVPFVEWVLAMKDDGRLFRDSWYRKAGYTIRPVYGSHLTNIISFADPEVKRICVENWDTDGDGELSYEEAAAVTDLDQKFKNNTTITSFDELQYFTGLTYIGRKVTYSWGDSIISYDFQGCTNLTSVMIPENVEVIGLQAFTDCENLSSILIPKSVKEITQAFSNTGLTSLSLPEGSSIKLWESEFRGCKSLSTVSFGGEISLNVEEGVFAECPISSLYFGKDFDYDLSGSGRSLFANLFLEYNDNFDLNTNSIVVSSQNQKYDSRDNCNALIETATNTLILGCKNSSIPESVTRIGPDAFSDLNGLTSFVIPASVTSVEGSFDVRLTSITVQATTPPATTYGPFSYNYKNYDDEGNISIPTIYVPAGSVNAYKTAPGWSEYADYIQAIPDTPGFINGYAYVEMGDGLKWATMNVGASSPQDYGDYYAWGETEPKYVSRNPLIWKSGMEAGYDVSTYAHMTDGMSDWTGFNKYQRDDGFTEAIWYSDGGFIGDNITTLESVDDAAAVNWGGTWRMPTHEEWAALRNSNNFTWRWVTQNGIKGCTVTSKVPGYEGNQIFLPAYGLFNEVSYMHLNSQEYYGFYWSSSLYDNVIYLLDGTHNGRSSDAWCVDIWSGGVEKSCCQRYIGAFVRAVSR